MFIKTESVRMICFFKQNVSELPTQSQICIAILPKQQNHIHVFQLQLTITLLKILKIPIEFFSPFF